MALLWRQGDLFQEDVAALVNPVNCVGVMGRGLALQFKRNFPDNFTAYVEACKQGRVQPGQMFVTETHAGGKQRLLINFPTKRHWRAKSRLADIQAGLADLAQVIGAKNIQSLALPALGCGLGGLDWALVKPEIERVAALFSEVTFVVFPPHG